MLLSEEVPEPRSRRLLSPAPSVVRVQSPADRSSSRIAGASIGPAAGISSSARSKGSVGTAGHTVVYLPTLNPMDEDVSNLRSC